MIFTGHGVNDNIISNIATEAKYFVTFKKVIKEEQTILKKESSPLWKRYF